jgi:hypothetical protein
MNREREGTEEEAKKETNVLIKKYVEKEINE